MTQNLWCGGKFRISNFSRDTLSKDDGLWPSITIGGAKKDNLQSVIHLLFHRGWLRTYSHQQLDTKFFPWILHQITRTYLTFHSYYPIYYKTIFNMTYKRTQRALNTETKAKISAKLKGRKKSLAHRQNISKSMTEYWSKVQQNTTDENKA